MVGMKVNHDLVPFTYSGGGFDRELEGCHAHTEFGFVCFADKDKAFDFSREAVSASCRSGCQDLDEFGAYADHRLDADGDLSAVRCKDWPYGRIDDRM